MKTVQVGVTLMAWLDGEGLVLLEDLGGVQRLLQSVLLLMARIDLVA